MAATVTGSTCVADSLFADVVPLARSGSLALAGFADRRSGRWPDRCDIEEVGV